MRALGFNAVKLPFSFGPLLGSAIADISTACTTATADHLQVSTPASCHFSSSFPQHASLTYRCILRSVALSAEFI